MTTAAADLHRRSAAPRRLFHAPQRPGVPMTPLDVWSFLIIGSLTFFTRFVRLSAATSGGTPVFDEKHYVPQAFDMVKSSLGPITGGIELNPGYGLVVHPPLGKQLLAIGESVFGYTPLGWRVITAAFGVATVLLTMALARRLSGSPLVGLFAGILGLCDGVLLVSSRFGMLDIFQVLFVVAAAYFLARDHDQMVARLLDARGTHPVIEGTRGGWSSPLGPRLGYRWWRFAAGVALGLAVSVKWSGMYYMAFFGLMTVALDAATRRRFGVQKPWLGALLRDAVPAFCSLVILPVLLYLWSWRAWFANETSVYRHSKSSGDLAEKHGFLQFLPESWAGFVHYHLEVLHFHASLTSSGGHHHPWDSKPWSWLVASRPVLYLSDTSLKCSNGAECRKMIFLFGTPPIWWLTVPVVCWALWQLVIRRRMRPLIPLVAFAAGFLPWVAAFDRQMYFFYATALVPFTIVLIAMALGRLVHWQATSKYRWGLVLTSFYLALVVTAFLYWLPIFYGLLITDAHYYNIMWFRSWR